MGVSEQLYTIKEAAERLKVCEATIYRQIKAGGIKSVRVGRNVRIPGNELQKLFQPA